MVIDLLLGNDCQRLLDCCFVRTDDAEAKKVRSTVTVSVRCVVAWCRHHIAQHAKKHSFVVVDCVEEEYTAR